VLLLLPVQIPRSNSASAVRSCRLTEAWKLNDRPLRRRPISMSCMSDDALCSYLGGRQCWLIGDDRSPWRREAGELQHKCDKTSASATIPSTFCRRAQIDGCGTVRHGMARTQRAVAAATRR